MSDNDSVSQPRDKQGIPPSSRSFQDQLAELTSSPVAGTTMTAEEAAAHINAGNPDIEAQHGVREDANEDEDNKPRTRSRKRR